MKKVFLVFLKNCTRQSGAAATAKEKRSNAKVETLWLHQKESQQTPPCLAPSITFRRHSNSACAWPLASLWLRRRRPARRGSRLDLRGRDDGAGSHAGSANAPWRCCSACAASSRPPTAPPARPQPVAGAARGGAVRGAFRRRRGGAEGATRGARPPTAHGSRPASLAAQPQAAAAWRLAHPPEQPPPPSTLAERRPWPARGARPEPAVHRWRRPGGRSQGQSCRRRRSETCRPCDGCRTAASSEGAGDG